MAKTLSFTDNSPQTVKIGDTTTSFTLVCGNDNLATDLTNATSITAKLGNASGYLKSVTVDPASLTDPTTGQVIVNFNADLMTNLPAGGYTLEVWVVDSTGTSIYPSDGSTGFNITNNIQSTNGSTITTITFDDFVKAMNKAASTIAKGDKGEKGDTGTVDNAGLTTAPAFQALQTQVNNSAVGTNLLTDSSFESGIRDGAQYGYANGATLSVSSDYSYKGTYSLKNYLGDTSNVDEGLVVINKTLAANTKYTFSTWIYSETAIELVLVAYANQDWTDRSETPVTIPATTWTRISTTLTTDSSGNGCKIGVFKQTSTDTPTFYLDCLKLEKGSVATDWSVNPSEILTQSDYAKIQAAIVALGGSLS
ncbi:carbohydrate binding domain-containing protein [Lactiplantibacillus plantarum]